MPAAIIRVRFGLIVTLVLWTVPVAILGGETRADVGPTYFGVSSRLHDLTAITSTVEEHAAHPALRLVSAMVPWRVLEPAKGAYDWSQLDANVADAQAAGYKLILRVMAGRLAPSWLYDAGVQKIRLLGTNQFASDYCQYLDAPVPWDPGLATHYTDLVRALAAWLQEPDGAGGSKGDHVFLIPVAMPTFLGTEMVIGYGGDSRCPGRTEAAGLNLRTYNVAAWDAISTETERRSWTEEAWRQAIDIHMQHLPSGTRSVIAYGHLFQDQQAAARRIAVQKVPQYPDRLWSMYTNLQPQVTDDALGPWRDWCPPCHDVIAAIIARGGAVGFQTAGENVNDTFEKLRSAVEDGLATYGMRFLETQPSAIDGYEGYLLTDPSNAQERIAAAATRRTSATGVSCGSPVAVNEPTTCTATVTDTDAGTVLTPGGTDLVLWTTSGAGTFTSASCTPTGASATAACSVAYTPVPGSAGVHEITATYSGDTNHGGSQSAAFGLAVEEPSPDTTPPTVSITFPPDGGEVKRGSAVTIAASASDDVGVARVEFLVNGGLKCTVLAAPYTCVWRVPRKGEITYTLRATAYDGAGNSASHSILAGRSEAAVPG